MKVFRNTCPDWCDTDHETVSEDDGTGHTQHQTVVAHEDVTVDLVQRRSSPTRRPRASVPSSTTPRTSAPGSSATGSKCSSSPSAGSRTSRSPS